MVKRIRVLVIAGILGTAGLELTEHLLPHGTNGLFVSTVEAVIGRPLTPVSMSGVARRTSRRCSAEVYDC